MKIQVHKVNFKHNGAWYELEDGRGIYLAHRRLSQVYRKRHAWALERLALEEAQERGYVAAGVVVKKGKRKLVWLTPIEDFFGPEAFTNPENPLQRCLPLNRFALIPMMLEENIEAAMRLR